MKGLTKINLEQLTFTERGTFFDKKGKEINALPLGAGVCYYEDYKYSTNSIIPKTANAFALGQKESQYKDEFPIVYLKMVD
jgi:hypothetical protein